MASAKRKYPNGPADLFEVLAKRIIDAAGTAPGEQRLLCRNPEDSLLEPGQGSLHVATRISHRLRRIPPDNAESVAWQPSWASDRKSVGPLEELRSPVRSVPDQLSGSP
jgi:hypothetical protein